MLVSFEPHRTNPQLFAFLNAVNHRERRCLLPQRAVIACRGSRVATTPGSKDRFLGTPVAGDPCLSILCLCRAGLGYNGGLEEAVVLIESLKCVDVGSDQRLAVVAVAVESIGGMNIEQFFERSGVKIVVAG